MIRLKREHFVPDHDLIVAFTADEEAALSIGRRVETGTFIVCASRCAAVGPACEPLEMKRSGAA